MTDRKETKFIVIHCSDTPETMDIGYKEIRGWHLAKGWSDIGYNAVIRRSGQIEMGRDTDQDGDTFDDIGAHVEGFNARSVGVCMVGGKGNDGKPEKNFTAAQWEALEMVVRYLLQRYPNAEVLGHRDFPNVQKACPCFDVKAWWASVQAVA